MKYTVLIVGLIVATILITPVLAEGRDGGHNSGTQTTINAQDVQSASNTVTGEDNTAINNNVNTQGGTNINSYDGTVIEGTTAVSNSQSVNVIIPSSPYSKTFDLGITQTAIVTLFNGEVYVADNDKTLKGIEEIQRKGDVYKYTIKSSNPVLAYVIDANDVYKVKSLSGEPVYDWANQRYDHSGVVPVFPTLQSPQQYNHPSDLQSFNVTMPEDGRYSLVIDTRINKQPGIASNTNVNDNTLDITFSIQKVVSGQNVYTPIPVIGTTAYFQYTGVGLIDNSKTVEITH